MFEKRLQSFIPKTLSSFPKINGIGDPYHFKKWDLDIKGQKPILRYWFWNKGKTYQNKKRVFINEFEALLRLALIHDGFERSDFEKVCPKTYSDGTCGFPVIVAILDYLEVIEKTKPGCYSLINKGKIKELFN